MIVSAHQPHYFPWVGYINKIYLSDIFVVVDNVQFVRNLVSKNRLINSRGEFSLTIPVKGSKSSFFKKIRDIEVSYDRAPFWYHKHLKSIEHNYRRSENFEVVFNRLEKIYTSKPISLLDLDMQILEFILEFLNIKTKIVYASDLGIVGAKEDGLMIDILDKTKSDNLLLGIGASTRYVNKDVIISRGYNIVYQKFIHPIYKQKCKSFIGGVSVFDLILSNNRIDAEFLVKSCGVFK